VIELRDVGVDRPGRPTPILDGVSFTLSPGERVALLGGNGSGKTTLARLLNGTQLPARGRVLVDGHDTRDAAARIEVRRAVGLLFQDPDDQFVSTTVEREIAFGLENLAQPTAVIRTAVDTAIREFGLEALRQAPPHEISGGEKARLALACVWVMQPRCLVLDETESLLDRRGREQLRALLAALPAATILVQVTTDAEQAVLASRILVLHEGRLVGDGSPDDVFAQLPEHVMARTGQPIAWRVSPPLQAAGRVDRPTTSLERLLEALRARSRAESSSPPMESR